MVDVAVNAGNALKVDGEGGKDFTEMVRMSLSEVFTMLGFASKEDIKEIKEDIKASNARTAEDIKEIKEDIRASNARTAEDIKRLDAAINKVDAKIDAVSKDLNGKIDAVSNDLNARIDKVDSKIDAVSKDLNGKIDVLGNRMWHVGAAIITTVIVVAKFFAHS
jgi:septal ring factor EnvC (AmiA/AmiB activator)